MSLKKLRSDIQERLIEKLLCESDEAVSDLEIALIATAEASEFGARLASAVRRVVEKRYSLPFSVQERVDVTFRESAIMNYGHCHRTKTPRPWYDWVHKMVFAFVCKCAAPATIGDIKKRSENYAIATWDVVCAFSQFLRTPMDCSLQAGWSMVKFSSFVPAKRCHEPGTMVPDSWFVNFVRLLLERSYLGGDWTYAEDASLHNYNLLNVMRVQANMFEDEEYKRVGPEGVYEIRKITGDVSAEDVVVPVTLEEEDFVMDTKGCHIFFFDENGPELVSSTTTVVDVENKVCGKRKYETMEEDFSSITSMFPSVKKKKVDVFMKLYEEDKKEKEKGVEVYRKEEPEPKRCTKVRFLIEGEHVPERKSKHRMPTRIFPHGEIEALRIDFDVSDIDVNPSEVKSVAVC